MKKLIMLVALLAGAVCDVQAASEADLRIAEMDKSYFVLRSSGGFADCLKLTYIGESTEAVATVTSATFISYIQESGVLTEEWGVSLAAAGYDTMGEFCAYVDNLTDYKCELAGCPENWDTVRLRDVTAATTVNNMKANHAWYVQTDTGPVYGAGTVTKIATLAVGRTPRKGKRLSVLSCNMLVNAIGDTGKVEIYGKPKWAEGDGESYSTANKVWQGYVPDDVSVSSPTFNAWGTGALDFALNSHVAVTAGNQEVEQTGNWKPIQVHTNYLECLFREQ